MLGSFLVCTAMHIGKYLNGHDLVSDDLYIAAPDQAEDFTIVKRPRIGVDYAGRWAKRLLRFSIKGHPCVSRP